MNLAKEIAYLLYKHNCVIIPEFGAFLVNEKKVERNLEAKFANPKSKAISFNSQIKNNDGLLANCLSNKYQYSYEQGVTEIKTYVNELNSKLAEKRNAEVSEIGTFYLTKEEKLIFVPYHSVNFEIASFGLPKLRLKTIQVSENNTTPTPKAIPTEIVKPTRIVEQKSVVRGENKIVVQETKRALKLESKTKNVSDKKNSLVWINVLGTLMIVAIAAGIARFEFTNNSKSTNASFAELIDSPSTSIEDDNLVIEDFNEAEISEPVLLNKDNSETEVTPIKEETANAISDKYKLHLFAVCTEPQKDTMAAEALKTQLSSNFPGAFVWKENENYRVQIIALSKEKLAAEYKEMAQRKVKQKLVIKEK